MKTLITKRLLNLAILIPVILMSCQALTPSSSSVDEPPTQEPTSMPQQNGFSDLPAIPNDSGIEGVQTFPDKAEYHNHVAALTDPEGNIPSPFGAHFGAWQNCGIYNQPIELGSVLHSMEHGAVWLTYSTDLSDSQIVALQSFARGHAYVLMSPYPPQTKPVVLSAWGVQLVIDTLPDDRIAKFIAYYEQGPQNPEPGAPCSGAIGNPLP